MAEVSSAPVRRPFHRRRKTCPFSGANAPKIDYKDIRLLQRYISERGKIVPSRITAVSPSGGFLSLPRWARTGTKVKSHVGARRISPEPAPNC